MRALYCLFLVAILGGLSLQASASQRCGSYCEDITPINNEYGTAGPPANTFCARAIGGYFYYTSQGTCQGGTGTNGSSCNIYSGCSGACVTVTDPTHLAYGGSICNCPPDENGNPQEPTPNGCGTPVPTCEDSNQSWDETFGCIDPPPECPSGQIRDVIDLGGYPVYTCTDPLPPSENCVVVGYGGNGIPICVEEEEVDDCTAGGGTFVYSHTAERGLCILDPPPEAEPEIPDCTGNNLLVQSDTGDWSCRPVYDTGPDDEDLGNPDESGAPDRGNDTDGDGIPNTNDPDIDGDGILNGVDPDIDGDTIININDPDMDGDGITNDQDGDMDGDGIRNGADDDIDGDGVANDTDTDDDGDGTSDGDDSQPGGTESDEGTETDQSITGGGNCAPESQPTCDGDEPILCAIAIQTWKTQCALNDDTFSGSGDCSAEIECEGDAIQCGIAKIQWENGCYSQFPDGLGDKIEITENDPSNLDEGDTDIGAMLQGIYNQPANYESCPSPDQISVAGATLDISYQPFCDFAVLIRPVVLFFFGLLAFRITLRAF